MGTSLPDPFPMHAGVVSQGWDWSTEVTKQNSHRSEVPRLRILSLRSSACQMDGGSRVCARACVIYLECLENGED